MGKGKVIIMVRSMTGFGRCEVEEDGKRILVEMKAVNHRYFDLGLKMPKKLNAFEAAIRGVLKEDIERGKIDVYITLENLAEDNVTIKYNKEVAKTYLDFLNQMEKDFTLDNDIRVSTLSRYPEVFTMEEAEADEDELWRILEKALRGAIKGFCECREKEGENLKADLIGKLDNMSEYVDYIETRSPDIIAEYRGRLENKVRDLLGDAKVDEGRLLTEVTVYADRICVDEEIVRLKSHIKGTKDTLLEGGAVGRKLDFLAQEMNREANTILSKSTDVEISERGILLKTEIEKVREQIQNIE